MNHNYVVHWGQLKELNVVGLISYMAGFYKNCPPLLNPKPFKDTVITAIYRFYFVNWIVFAKSL